MRHTKSTNSRASLVFLLGLSLSTSQLGCETSSNNMAPASAKPVLASVEDTGPFWSGTRTHTYTRADGQEVTVQLWYPTSDEMGTAVRYDGFLDGESWVDAVPDCQTKRPVVVFSHGNGGIRWQSDFNMHFLATHGFVVIAMDHLQNTFSDLNRSLFPEHTLQRPRDVHDSFNWLVATSEIDTSDLFGCIEANDGYAVMGHSFGGYTTFMVAGATVEVNALTTACTANVEAACRIVELWRASETNETINLGDPRVWAAVAWAPWDAGGMLAEGMASIDVPALTLTGTLDELTPLSQVSGLVDASDNHEYVHFNEAGHFSFAPMSCMLISGDGCGEGYMDIERVKTLTNRLVTSFLGAQLGWETGAQQFEDIDESDLIWQRSR